MFPPIHQKKTAHGPKGQRRHVAGTYVNVEQAQLPVILAHHGEPLEPMSCNDKGRVWLAEYQHRVLARPDREMKGKELAGLSIQTPKRGMFVKCTDKCRSENRHCCDE